MTPISSSFPPASAHPATTGTPPDIIAPVVHVLGIPFHAMRLNLALDKLEQFIRQRTPRHICLSNAYTVALAKTDPELRSLLIRADLVLPDGMSIVWGSRWIGVRLPERVAGPDVMAGLCARAEKQGYSLYLLGSSPENLNLLRSELLRRWPGLKIAGVHSPSMCESFSAEENRDIIKRIRECAPDILFVGMSCPKQEKWISKHLENLKVPVSLGVGAAFNFLSGSVPRAPEYLQRIGLEWFYRLYREPRRLWKRYLLGNAIFLALLATQCGRRIFSHWTFALTKRNS
jgi:N-acetylglucosaminyldiphosphoundecaprenol N-acetyl-beta-D-mannosaminyltransferase